MNTTHILSGLKDLTSTARQQEVVAYDELGNEYELARMWVDDAGRVFFVVRPTNGVASKATLKLIEEGGEE